MTLAAKRRESRKRVLVMKAKDDIFRFSDVIRETSFALHQYLRHGHLEKVYEN